MLYVRENQNATFRLVRQCLNQLRYRVCPYQNDYSIGVLLPSPGAEDYVRL
jgi:hypothetical protein